MASPLAPTTRSPSPSVIRLGQRVIVVISVAAAIFISLWLTTAWISVKIMVSQRAEGAAILAAGQTENLLTLMSDHLAELATHVKPLLGSTRAKDHDEALQLLRNFVAEHSQVGNASIVLSSGQAWIVTATAEERAAITALSQTTMANDFKHDIATAGFHIDRPIGNQLTGKMTLPLSYTFASDNGEPVFLVQAEIPLEKQQAVWRNLRLEFDVFFGLVRDDGYLLSRWPSDKSNILYETSIANGEMFRTLETRPRTGTFDDTRVNGEGTIGAYARVEGFPTFAFVAIPGQTVLAIWWKSVRLPLLFIIGTLLAGSFIHHLLGQRFSRRMNTIRKRLESESDHIDEPLPNSGVKEIDELCTALLDARDRLSETSRNREKLLLEAAEAGTYAVRQRDGVVVAADPAFAAMLGMTPSEVIQKPWESLLAPATGRLSLSDERQDDAASRVMRMQNKNGRPIWLSLAEYIEYGGGEILRYGLAIDVTQRENLLRKVHNQSQRLQALWKVVTGHAGDHEERIKRALQFGLDRFSMDVVLFGEIIDNEYVIHDLADKLGLFNIAQRLPIAATLCAHTLKTQKSFFVNDLAAEPEFRDHAVVRQFGIRTYASAPIWLGETLYGTLVFMRREPLPEGVTEDDKAFMELLASWFSLSLIQQRQRVALENLAMTDALTELPNRRAADLRLSSEIARGKRAGEAVAIALCDLDHFKLINDHYGHDTGDIVLREAARVMQGALREGDWMARWGGEEFFVFLHNADETEALAAMERLRHAVKSTPIRTPRGMVNATTSVGIGVLRSVDDDITQLLAEADGCLYEAKRSGRDRVVLSEGVQRSVLWRAGLLQRALQENRIVPAYQVVVNLQTGEPVANEVLARLIDPEGQEIEAKNFVEAAEGINLIHIVDQVITQQAVRHCMAGLAEGRKQADFLHFVNLSPQFLARRDLVAQLLDTVTQYCAELNVAVNEPKPIVFEITERQPLRDFHGLLHDLQPLLDLGFRLALDDFGSGYSSFLYLAELPISFLKIEGWLVCNMNQNTKVRAMVENIVQLAKTQGIVTIAECIEDQATADALRAMGVDWGQGYFYGSPARL